MGEFVKVYRKYQRSRTFVDVLKAGVVSLWGMMPKKHRWVLVLVGAVLAALLLGGAYMAWVTVRSSGDFMGLLFVAAPVVLIVGLLGWGQAIDSKRQALNLTLYEKLAAPLRLPLTIDSIDWSKFWVEFSGASTAKTVMVQLGSERGGNDSVPWTVVSGVDSAISSTLVGRGESKSVTYARDLSLFPSSGRIIYSRVPADSAEASTARVEDGLRRALLFAAGTIILDEGSSEGSVTGFGAQYDDSPLSAQDQEATLLRLAKVVPSAGFEWLGSWDEAQSVMWFNLESVTSEKSLRASLAEKVRVAVQAAVTRANLFGQGDANETVTVEAVTDDGVTPAIVRVTFTSPEISLEAIREPLVDMMTANLTFSLPGTSWANQWRYEGSSPVLYLGNNMNVRMGEDAYNA